MRGPLMQGSLHQQSLEVTTESSSTLEDLQSDAVEVVMFIAPPELPLALETDVAVEVKGTVRVRGCLNSAN